MLISDLHTCERWLDHIRKRNTDWTSPSPSKSAPATYQKSLVRVPQAKRESLYVDDIHSSDMPNNSGIHPKMPQQSMLSDLYC